MNFQRFGNRRSKPAPRMSAHASKSDVVAVRRPLPPFCIVTDAKGNALVCCRDGGDAWDLMHELPGARRKTDHEGRELAYRGKWQVADESEAAE